MSRLISIVEGIPQSAHPLYKTWRAVIDRCLEPRNASYANYGGRGIRICDRWLSSFEAFVSDMGSRPSESHSIDRKDNDGHYEPGNCAWATKREQALKRRPQPPRIHGWALPPANEGMRQLRETVNRRMTVVGMAKALGFSHPTISNWLAGHAVPGEKSRLVIERVYGIASSDWDIVISASGVESASSKDEPFHPLASAHSPARGTV